MSGPATPTNGRPGRRQVGARVLSLVAAALCSVPGPLQGQSADPGVSGLALHPITSTVFGNERMLRVLVPAGYFEPANRDRRYPVLYLNDGQNLFDTTTAVLNRLEWAVDETVRRLTAAGEIEPIIVVGIDNAGRRERGREYLPFVDEYLRPPEPDPQGARYPRFLLDEVKPFIDATYRTQPDRAHTALGGSSYGALIALYTAILRPEAIGQLLLESPSLYVHNDSILTLARAASRWPDRVYLGVGTNEGGRPNCVPADTGGQATSDVRRLAEILSAQGLGPARSRTIIVPCATHNEQAWAARLPEALRFLFAGPNAHGRARGDPRSGAEAGPVPASAVSFFRLGPEAAVLQDSAYGSNMTVVRTTAGLVVVDNFMHRSSTRLALSTAADSFRERRIALAINTHGHDDHTWGNQLLGAGTDPPPILGHAATIAYMQRRVAQMRDFFARGPAIAKAAEDTLAFAVGLPDSVRGRLQARAARIRHNLGAHSDLVVTAPTVPLMADTVVAVGRTRVVLRSIGAAHSAGDVAVVFPDVGVMAVGDIALTDDLPGLDAADGDLNGWVDALEALEGEAPGSSIRWVVPGHGPVGDLATLRATANYLRGLRDSVSAALADGLELEGTQARVGPQALWTRGADRERHLRNVEAAWRLLRARSPR